MKHLKVLAAAALASLGIVSAPAFATFEAAICPVVIGAGCATGLVVTDNGAGDANPLVGAITMTFTSGGLTVLVNTSLSKPQIGSAAAPHLDITYTIVGAGTVTMYATDTDFTGTGPMSGGVTGNNFTGSGTGVATVFESSTNVAGALSQQVGTTGSFAATGAYNVPLTTSAVGFGGNPYSLTLGIQFVQAGGTNTGDVGITLTKIPEPASLALLGIGLAGLGFVTRRKQA